MFMKATLREQEIPFKLKTDPFYAEADLRRLRRSIWEHEQGAPSLQMTMDELVEMDEKGRTPEMEARIAAFRKAHAEWSALHPYPEDNK